MRKSLRFIFSPEPLWALKNSRLICEAELTADFSVRENIRDGTFDQGCRCLARFSPFSTWYAKQGAADALHCHERFKIYSSWGVLQLKSFLFLGVVLYLSGLFMRLHVRQGGLHDNDPFPTPTGVLAVLSDRDGNPGPQNRRSVLLPFAHSPRFDF
jgi:hypothetical protein